MLPITTPAWQIGHLLVAPAPEGSRLIRKLETLIFDFALELEKDDRVTSREAMIKSECETLPPPQARPALKAVPRVA